MSTHLHIYLDQTLTHSFVFTFCSIDAYNLVYVLTGSELVLSGSDLREKPGPVPTEKKTIKIDQKLDLDPDTNPLPWFLLSTISTEIKNKSLLIIDIYLHMFKYLKKSVNIHI